MILLLRKMAMIEPSQVDVTTCIHMSIYKGPLMDNKCMELAKSEKNVCA
jgi:hypothetical protein